MSVLSDRTIYELCTPPTHVLWTREPDVKGRMFKAAWAGSSHTAEDLEQLVRRGQGAVMSERLMEELNWSPMITPYEAGQVRTREVNGAAQRTISHGTSSYGYDVTLAEEFKIFTNINSAVIDPKRLDLKCLADGVVQHDAETGEAYVLLPPNSYLLGRTNEAFDIPRDITVVCVGKSTYARAGAIVNVTPIEAGFKGVVVIEISNSTNLPLKIYANEGIAQFIFYRGDQSCKVSYGDRGGKYQNQSGIQLPLV